MFKACCLAVLVSAVLGSAYSAQASVNGNGIEEAIIPILSGDHRSEENKARDDFRHPQRVIGFYEIKPSDTVLEVWPGNGWYSEILGPYLKAEGQLVAATFGINNENSKDKRLAFWSKIATEYREKMADEELYGNVIFTEFEPPERLDVAEVDSIDKALIIRSLHIWDEVGQMQQGLQSVFKALKPGGLLGIIQHRSTQLSDFSSSAPEGYLAENYVIQAAENAGFKLVESSDINSNPKDTKDYPKGVYTLPPTLAMGALDQDKYLAIGESDRMTLKFVKPK
ncbi:methyltransferase [Psychrosphaera sp.]|nr:methyltransferase [Psychrosphaera sp.]